MGIFTALVRLPGTLPVHAPAGRKHCGHPLFHGRGLALQASAARNPLSCGSGRVRFRFLRRLRLPGFAEGEERKDRGSFRQAVQPAGHPSAGEHDLFHGRTHHGPGKVRGRGFLRSSRRHSFSLGQGHPSCRTAGYPGRRDKCRKGAGPFLRGPWENTHGQWRKATSGSRPARRVCPRRHPVSRRPGRFHPQERTFRRRVLHFKPAGSPPSGSHAYLQCVWENA